MQAQAQLVRTEAHELDTGDVLEAEAARRAALSQDATVVVGDTRSRQRLLKVIGSLVAVFAVAMVALAITAHFWHFFVFAFLFALESAGAFWASQHVARQSKPRLTISALGVTIDTPLYSLGPVFWDEIKTARYKNLLGMRYVEITLKNLKTTYARSLHVKPSPFAPLNRWTLAVSPIQIMEMYFGGSAKEMAARIASHPPSPPLSFR